MTIGYRSAILALPLGFLPSSQVMAQEADVAAIRALQNEQAPAWNRHDAAAYARLFTEDGDVVNVLGWWWRGREEIERKLSNAFAFVFAESRLNIVEVHVRRLETQLRRCARSLDDGWCKVPAGFTATSSRRDPAADTAQGAGRVAHRQLSEHE